LFSLDILLDILYITIQFLLKLQRKGTHSHRGVIGVESAIVMIAFVIVAAALAFVVLNMGFSTTQKAKTVTISGLNEASSGMEVSGRTVGIGCTTSTGGCATTGYLNATTVPIKVSPGGDSVDLNPNTTIVRYLSKSVEYQNIYSGTITSSTFDQPVLAFRQAALESGSDFDAFNGANPVNGTLPSETKAFVYWAKRGDSNGILDLGEHAILAIGYSSSDRPTSLDNIDVEIIVATGAALTVERDIPNITSLYVDLG